MVVKSFAVKTESDVGGPKGSQEHRVLRDR